ncbi:MAG: hypothetical protein KF713_16950 [Turneriella sp.]|nr:hypothetical protein [Turneriella sp.]
MGMTSRAGFSRDEKKTGVSGISFVGVRMQCKRQPGFLQDKPVQISHLLEVRLAPAHWNQIQRVARRRRRTFSTVTRYCTLRLARKCSLRWTAKLDQTFTAVRQGFVPAEEQHRHLMCLYGEDEKIIRLAAMELGLTISAFVRLALELYLPCLAMEKHSQMRVSDAELTWEGIRIIENVQIFAVNGSSRPFYRNLSCTHFDPSGYW